MPVAATQLPELQRGSDDDVDLHERDYSTTERIAMASRGAAIPVRNDQGDVVNGRYPIDSAEDVQNAVDDANRTGAGAEDREHIIKNAERVGAVGKIPAEWHRVRAGLKPRGTAKQGKPKDSPSVKPKGGKRGKVKPAREATRFRVELRETNVRKSGSAYEATVLREGPGNPSDRNAYSREALRKAVAAGMFEGLQCYANHPTASEERDRPERDVRQLVGHFREAKYVEDGGRAAVRAKFVPVQGPGYEWVTSLIESALKAPAGKPLIGISIDGYGHAPDEQEINGRRYNMVQEITHLGSADIVTRAGAGGQFHRRLSESMADARDSVGDAPKLTGRQLQKQVRKALRRLEAALADEDDDQVREAFVTLHEAAGANVTLPTASAVRSDKLERVRAKLAKERQRRRLAEQHAATADRATLAGRLLREVKVPPATEEAWFADLIGQPDEPAVRVLLDRRRAERESHMTELRESIGIGQIEGAGRRESIGPSAPPESDLLARLGIDPDDL